MRKCQDEVRKLFTKIDQHSCKRQIWFKRPRTATSKRALIKNILFTLPFGSAPWGVVHLMLIIWKLLTMTRSFYAIMEDDSPQTFEPEAIWN
jgi:hypothetical protein